MGRARTWVLMLAAASVAAPTLSCSGVAADELACADAGDPEACLRAFEDGTAAPAAGDDAGVNEFNSPVLQDDGAACTALLSKTCGSATSSSCSSQPGCAAARLLATYEPWECETALDNEQSYPPCQASGCELLVAKVCGEDATCSSSATCEVAEQWQQQALNSAKAADRDDAERACGAALADDVVFPSCG